MKIVIASLLLFAATGSCDEPKFSSIEGIAATIPASVELQSKRKWSVIGIEKANKALADAAVKQPAKVRIKVQVFEPFKHEPWGYRIMAVDDQVGVRGVKLPYRFWAYFKPDQADPLAKVTKGSTITLSGMLEHASIKMDGDKALLEINLGNAKVEK